LSRKIVIIFGIALLAGCSGLSRQYRASTEGMSLKYIVKKEHLLNTPRPLNVLASDERIDKELIGDGAKSTVGNKFIGYLAFGVFYAAAPDQPTFQDKQDPIKVFKSAMEERLKNNGINISNDVKSPIILELSVRRFKLDFNFGKWIAEAGYVARAKNNGVIICEKEIFEKTTKFNVYGYGSGEEAFNEAFNKAINALDVNACFN